MMLFIFRNVVSIVVNLFQEVSRGVSKGPAKPFRRKALLASVFLAALLVAVISIALANNTAQTPTFKQDWSNTGLITANNNWNSVPGIIGYNGTGLAISAGTDPQTILLDGSLTPTTVLANQTNTGQNTGGVAEFQLANPTIALQGDNTASAPHIVVNLDTTNRSNIRVSYNLRDLDGSNDNAAQQVALQYRVGSLGNYTNIPAGYVADATTQSQATQVTPVNVTLPAAADNQSLVQLRVITSKATSNQKDEWVGIDDISVTSTPTASAQSVTTNAAKMITLTGTDADGDNLTFAIASGPTNGTLSAIGTPTCTGTAPKTCQANVTYTPNAGYNGSDSFNFRVNDGTVNSTDATVSISVDTVAPSVPSITSPANNSYDNDGAFTLSGTAEANSTVELFEDAQSKDTTTANGSGNWSVALSGVSEGDHTYTAKATDAAGNTSSSSTAVTVKVDQTAPGAPTVELDAASDTGSSNTDDITNDNTPTFSGTAEAGSTVKLYDGGSTLLGTTTANNLGNWSFTPGSALTDGTHSITATATDVASNASAASTALGVNVDTVAPQTVIGSGPLGLINSTTAVFVFLSNELGSTFECKLDSGVFGSCNSPKIYNGLSQGSHTFQAQSTDTAGNTDQTPDSRSFSVDSATPDAPEITSPANGTITNDNTPTFSGTAEASSTVNVYDDSTLLGTTTADGSGDWSFTPSTSLNDGTHSISATATDTAGNESTYSTAISITIDTVAPSTPQITSPANNSYDNDGAFTVSGTAEANSTVELFEGTQSKGTTTANGSGNWSVALSGVSEGDHTYTAKATDAAGNTSSSSTAVTVEVDTTAPSTPVIASPANNTLTNDATPTFSGTAEADSMVELFDDGSTSLGTTTTDGSGDWSFTPSDALADGSHSVTAKAADAVGNISSASTAINLTVDTAAPSAPSITNPTNSTITNDATPTFGGAAEANSTVELFDGGSTSLGTTTADGSGNWSFTPGASLNEGSHSITVIAEDAAGNTSTASTALGITIDTVAPSAPQITAPSNGAVINDATPTFGGTAEANSTVEVFDGNTSLDTTAADGSGDWSFTPGSALSEGNHSITATATDAAGNPSSASTALSVTIDATTPQTTIDSGTSGLVNSAAASFEFSSSETGSTFECKLDSGAFESCVSPKTYNGLSQGSHAFEVRATDVAGNTDGTPDSRTFTVDTQAPSAPQITSPANNSYDNDGAFTVSGTAEANSTVELFEGTQSKGTTTANGSGNWSVALSGVSEGDHTYTAKATDAADNESGSSNSVKLTVDTQAPSTTITNGPSGTTSDNTPSFEFSSNEVDSAFECRLTKQGDTPGTFASCDSGDSFGPLNDGEYTFEARAVDVAGNTGSVASRTFTVDTNHAPSPGAQSVTTDEDAPKAITLTASDPDGDNLNFEITNDPDKGTLGTIGSVNCTGTAPKNCSANVTYSPNTDYNGADSFKFRVNDGTVDSAKATVSITVNPVNDSPTADNDTATTDEDTAVVIDVKDGDTPGLSNESDQNLTVSSVTDPAKGTAEIITTGANAGKVRYTPDNNYTGTDSFGYTVCDNGTPSKCATATVNVNVTAVDDAPVARDDSYKGKQKKSLKIKTPGVLKNDEDTDSTNLSVQVIQGPTKGTLTLNNNGSFTYKPKGSFKGKDTFTYKVNDSARDSNTATVTITVR